MTKSKILASALLLALASSSNALIAQDDEMAQIAMSVANILNKHTAPVVAAPKHAITQDDFDRLVDQLAKKVPAPAQQNQIIPKHVVGQDDKQAQFDKLFEKLQAQLKVDTHAQAPQPNTIGDKYDQIVAKLMKGEKATESVHKPVESTHKPTLTFESKDKQKEFDELFEKLAKAHNIKTDAHVETQNQKQKQFDELFEKLQKAHNMKTEAPVQKENKQKQFDELFQKLQKAHQQAAPTKSIHAPSTKSIDEQENEIVAQLMRKTGVTTKDIVSSIKQETKPAPVGDKYDQIVAEILNKNGIKSNTVAPKPVEKKTEEKTSVGCLMAHAGTTSTIRKIAAASEKNFGTQSVRNVRELLEELVGKVDKVNSACEDKYKVEFIPARTNNFSTTCQKDFAMVGTLSKIFTNTHPGTIQRVMTTAKEMLAVRDHMKQNC